MRNSTSNPLKARLGRLPLWPVMLALAGTGLALTATSVGAVSGPTAPLKAVPDLAAACQPDAMQAAAAKLASGVTVKEIPNGPKYPGGVKYFAASAKRPAYCQVTGSYVTNPKTGKTANFMATFPAAWNGKYLQYGCFGHCGSLILNDAANPLVPIVGQGYPGDALRKGYAAFGTDEGHMGAEWAKWAIKGPGQVDEDAITDFVYRADQVLAKVGKKLTVAFYSQALSAPQKISYAYFEGCSGGGRDALVAAARFPEEFDGIIAGSPYGDMVGVGLQGTGTALATLRSPTADVSPELIAKVDPIVTAKCDTLDGVKDGLIQNPAACDFRPERDLPKCADDKPGAACFTKEQIETLSTVITAVTDEHGSVVQPGYSVSGLQAAFRPASRPKDLADPNPFPDTVSGGGGMASSGMAILKVLAHQNDPNFDARSIFSFRSGGPGSITDYRIVVPRAQVDAATQALQAAIGTDPANAAKLIQQNRKLMIWQNLSDQLLTPYMSYNYYKQLTKMYGGYGKLQNNIRLFGIPGTAHCSMSGIGPGTFDALTAMENWVEKGKGPDGLVARFYPQKGYGLDYSKPSTRSMPLCKFPEMARYSGKGDVNDAANWTCPADDKRMAQVGESGRRAGVIE